MVSYELVFPNAKSENIDIWFIYRCLVMIEWMWSQRIGGKPFFLLERSSQEFGCQSSGFKTGIALGNTTANAKFTGIF